jgi:hypothetical protein
MLVPSAWIKAASASTSHGPRLPHQDAADRGLLALEIDQYASHAHRESTFPPPRHEDSHETEGEREEDVRRHARRFVDGNGRTSAVSASTSRAVRTRRSARSASRAVRFLSRSHRAA